MLFLQGAVVANYPWDGTIDPNVTYSACPDDAAFRYLASTYANAHTDMHKSLEFPGGITNGAHWYPLSGGMQVCCNHTQTLASASGICAGSCTLACLLELSFGCVFLLSGWSLFHLLS